MQGKAVVTFLLTDIQGYSQLWEHHADVMPDVMAVHDRVVKEVIHRHQGTVLTEHGEGDSVFAVFHLASQAVAAARGIQLALPVQRWPSGVVVRVRIAIHTGEAGGDYRGRVANRCARVLALAHGGQVLLTALTAELARSSLPPSFRMVDRGHHLLRDVGPERIVESVVDPVAGAVSQPGGPSGRLGRRCAAAMHRMSASTAAAIKHPRHRMAVPAGLAAFLAVMIVAHLVLAAHSSPLGGGGLSLTSPTVGRVVFLSSQAQPAAEEQVMEHEVLRDFNGQVDFDSQPLGSADVDRIRAEHARGTSTVDVIALTHSDMLTLRDDDALEDLTPLVDQLLASRRIPDDLVDAGKYGTDKQYYIPWMQATYLMVVNKKAMQYRPAGVDVHNLTYDQLIAWGTRILEATGERRIGLPADLDGPRGGLIYRFLQGYAYPSFTRTTLTGFRSAEAVRMWETLRRLWSVTNPWSTKYRTMHEPLETGEVWIAWDHQARLKQALADSQRFEAVPAPSGPMGLGYMSVVVGLAIPKGAPNEAGARALIDWLTTARQQAAAATGLNFSPVVQDVVPTPGLAPALTQGLEVTGRYRANMWRVETLPPAGLGGHADEFTAVYQETFARIVLHGEDIPTVLNSEVPRLQKLVDLSTASCWPPDPPSQGPCRIV